MLILGPGLPQCWRRRQSQIDENKVLSAAAAIGCFTSNLIGLRQQAGRVQTCSFINRTFIKIFNTMQTSEGGQEGGVEEETVESVEEENKRTLSRN